MTKKVEISTPKKVDFQLCGGRSATLVGKKVENHQFGLSLRFTWPLKKKLTPKSQF